MDQTPRADGGSARSQATELDPDQWSARPLISLTIRLLVLLVPLAAAWMATRTFARVVDQPEGWLRFLYWVGAIGVASAVLMAVDRVARRFLPLAAMFRLSLVFPDRAPGRFKTALRTGTTAQLQRRLLSDDEDLPPGEAAALLLVLVNRLGRHDRRTRGHSERVRAYSDLIAEEMQLPEEDRQKLHWAALLHDVGKLSVPGELLNKADRPTDGEWTVLRRHPGEAASLVRGLDEWLGPWALAATEHHERFDGTGYPRGLAGTEISLSGRIVAVADAYDVMTSARSYKRAMSPAAARAELAANAGSHFDPVVVRAFLNVGIGRVRLAMGPLTGVSELIGVSQAPVAAAAAGVAAIAAVSSVATPSPDPEPLPAAVVEVAEAEPVQRAEPTLQLDFPSIPPQVPVTPETTTTLAPPDTTTSTTTSVAPTTTISSPPPPPTTSVPVPPPPPPPPPPTTTTVALSGPTAVDDSSSVEEEASVVIDVLGNDVAGSSPIVPSTLRITAGPSHAASVSVTADHRIRYRAREWEGTDLLTYEICDGNGLCAKAVVQITVYD